MGAFVSMIIGVGWVMSYALADQAILFFAVGFAVLTSFLSYWFSDKMVVAVSGAKPLKKEEDPELYLLVENLSIAAGLPAPRIYRINDPSPNAFATGRNPRHAIVAVTTGLRERLEKSELEGVLAHELSHIGNRDMLVATIAAALAGVIVMLVDIFLRMMVFGGHGRDRRGGGPLIAIGVIVVLVLAPIGATLLRLAVSRRREFLADASGALLTRYPEGLARALEKISAAGVPMRRRGDAMAHLWLSDPHPEERKKGKSRFFSLFMTHPPVEQRIRALRDMSV